MAERVNATAVEFGPEVEGHFWFRGFFKYINMSSNGKVVRKNSSWLI
jgi:hypothetical protein